MKALVNSNWHVPKYVLDCETFFTLNKTSTAGVYSCSTVSSLCHRLSLPTFDGDDGGSEKRGWSDAIGDIGVDLLMAPDFTCSTAASIDAM